jgi:glycosyltransferase involved in cell wall biosynthesis
LKNFTNQGLVSIEKREMTEAKPLVIACIPAYNEEKTIAKVVLQVKKYVDKVLVCDDGSTDITSEIAESLGVIVVRHERNLGKGAALRSSFNAGQKIGADVLVTLDGDDQHDPEEIPKLVEPILRGEADVVIGCRFPFNDSITARRRWGNRVLNFFTNLSAGGAARDTQSGFRAYSRMALNVIDVTEDGLGADSQIFIDAKEKDLKIVEVPVSTRYPRDVKTSKKNFLRQGSDILFSLFELVSERRPMFFLGIPGLVLLIVGGWYFILVLRVFNETRQFAIGHAMLGMASTLMGTLLLFGALILYVMSKRLRRLENRIRH